MVNIHISYRAENFEDSNRPQELYRLLKENGFNADMMEMTYRPDRANTINLNFIFHSLTMELPSQEEVRKMLNATKLESVVVD